jgi:SH3-like domain-containing protein
MLRLPIALISIIFLALAVPAHTATLPPKDECANIAGFAPVRSALQSAVKNRDAAAFLKLTSPTISWSFGNEDDTREGFAKQYDLNDPKKAKASPMWAELDELLKLGCSMEDNMIALPHMFWRMPTNPKGPMEILVTGTKVNLRAAPNLKSKIVASLSWEVVDEVGPDPRGALGWRQVKTAKGKRGYIREDFIRDRYDYRMIFSKVDGAWVITAFAAGD